MEFISTNNAPMPAGHYTQAIVCNGMVYVSSQLPVKPDRSSTEIGSIEEQTLQALQNVEQILIAANSSKELVVKVTVYNSDISLWGRINEVYGRFFGAHKPARAIVPNRELHYGYQIKIEVIASLNGQ